MRRQANIFRRKTPIDKIKEVFIAVLIAAIILFLALFIYFNFFGPESKIHLKDKVQAEVGSGDVAASEFIRSIKGGTLKKDALINTAKVGKKDVSVDIDFGKRVYTYTFEVEVVDTKAPTIDAPESFDVIQGSAFDPQKQFTVTDNSGKAKLRTEGKVDTAKTGDYPLILTAKDASGNENKKKITVHVIDIQKVEGDFTFTTAKGFTLERKDGITFVDGTLVVNKTFSIPADYAPGALTDETWNAFLEMRRAASAEGYYLYVASGYRSYRTQYALYEDYAATDGYEVTDTYSARPGFSEHQTGLAFDLNTVDDAFGETPEGKWVAAHCQEYGFILRYPKDGQEKTGFKFEPWHLRYVGKELAQKLYKDDSWITLEEYFGIPSAYAPEEG